MELICERKSGKIYRTDPICFYEVKMPELTQKEKELVGFITCASLKGSSISSLAAPFADKKQRAAFAGKVQDLLLQLDPYSTTFHLDNTKVYRIVRNFVNKTALVKHEKEVTDSIVRNLAGLGKLSYLLDDDELEEIMVNAPKQPIYVFDRKYGICKTLLVFEDEKEMMSIIERIARFVDKKVTRQYPILDARLPDGSRINSTIPPASPRGPTITIRKFRKKPYSIVDIVKNNTLNSELAAFLWMCTEGMQVSPKNMLFAGGTGSGKTTTLNALTAFIPQHERIVTIEDTLELNMHEREDWVQLESRPGIFENPLSTSDLLKNAIRMRPDRIMVGEVRGEEAEMMFVAMDIGHEGVMSTIHANSARETILRLQSRPMSVPTALFSLLDLIVMQHRMHVPTAGLIRRVTQVAEVSVMDDRVLLNDLFIRDKIRDDITRTGLPSQIIENISFLTGMSKKEIQKELVSRQHVINFLAEKNITDYLEIKKLIDAYYSNPVLVLEEIES